MGEFSEFLPAGLQTRIGRDGIGLSKGQIQRVLIARALLRSPRWLFLDEPTSALDAETERRVMENIKNSCRNISVVLIAHRLSTISDADHLIVMHEGRVAESGSPRQLMVRQGRYYDLVRHQMKFSEESSAGV